MNIDPEDLGQDKPHSPTGSNDKFDPSKVDPSLPKVRLVDGVSSENTYVVLAKNGEHRLCLRWMFFKAGIERLRNGQENPEGKECIYAVFKVHIEKDNATREEISKRSFAKFGLPSVFWFKSNRFTGLIAIPFAYMPNNLDRIEAGFKEVNFGEVLWETVCQPALDLNSVVDVDTRQFAKWVASQLIIHDLEMFAKKETMTRGYPTIRAYWDDLSGEADDQSYVSGSFHEDNYSDQPMTNGDITLYNPLIDEDGTDGGDGEGDD